MSDMSMPSLLREKGAIKEEISRNHILVHYLQNGKVHIMSSMIYETKEGKETYNNIELNTNILLMCQNLMDRYEYYAKLQEGENQNGIGTGQS